MLLHMRSLVVFLTCICFSTTREENTRWSRQISSYTADISDWVPLPGPVVREVKEQTPIKRQAVAEPRILSEPFPGFAQPTGFGPNSFPSRGFYQGPPPNRQLYLQSVPAVPSAPQNYLTDQGFGQSIRFGLSQPNFPLNQGFVAPQLPFVDNQQQKPFEQQLKQRPVGNPIKFEHFPKNVPVSPQAKPFDHFPKGVPPSPQAKPFASQFPKLKPEAPKFIDGYRVENVSHEFSHQKKKPLSLQKLKYDFDKVPKMETLLPNKPGVEREEVQLLYVPVESLSNKNQYNFRGSPSQTAQFGSSEIYSQSVPRPKQNFEDFQRPISKPVENFSFGQDYYNFNTHLNNNKYDQTPKFSTIASPFPTLPPTTPKPKKLKPHQPPLAIFLAQEAKRGDHVKVGDVLSSLKNANSIAVLDTVNPANAPKVFIGPNSLTPPENYVKFELPYLSNIENSDKKLRQLPFFVAPLSYNTPGGFAKIPFPSPHVGSVVINAQIKDTSGHYIQSTPSADVIPNSYSAAPAYKERKPVTQKPTFSYYSTSPPKTNRPQQSNYYSIEPQTVSTVRPKEPDSIVTAPPPRNYFVTNVGQQYNSNQYAKFPQNNNYNSETVRQSTTTRRTTTTTSTPKPSTYPSQLLETHNPYSINQAFHLSTPTDYQGYYEEKDGAATPSPAPVTRPSSVQPSTRVTQPEQIPVKYAQLKKNSQYTTAKAVTTEKYQTSQSPKYPTYLSRDEVITEKARQSTPNYLQNYSPEIHYESEIQNSRYPTYQQDFSTPDPRDYYTSKPEVSSEYKPLNNAFNNEPVVSHNTASSGSNSQYQNQNLEQQNIEEQKNNENQNSQYQNQYQNQNFEQYNTEPQKGINNENVNTQFQYEHQNSEQYHKEIQKTPGEYYTEKVSEVPTSFISNEYSTKSPYDGYDVSYETNENKEATSTTTTTTTSTTTTRRAPTRARGRPRYTTTNKPESNEGSSRTVATRRPLRERRPLPSRQKYDQNKITPEKSTKKPEESEASTKYTRGRTSNRGRVHFRPSESEELKKKPKHGTKEEDLAYQRDVLHQNYPVTLMERTSPVDIEAMTEPVPKISSTRNLEYGTEAYDTENAYTNEKPIQQSIESDVKDETTYIPRDEVQTAVSFIPNRPNLPSNEYVFKQRTSPTPIETLPPYIETEKEIYTRPRIALKTDRPSISHSTEPVNPTTVLPSYSSSNEFSANRDEEISTISNIEFTKSSSREVSYEENTEENIIQTTPSYNRVRVRPGGVRQYQQTSTTEAAKTERKRPTQAVTYRPAFVGRRTTMRIEEIAVDLKTKPVHARPEQDYRHPVYKPEPTTESSRTPISQDTAKRGQFRRRRPNYTTTTTSTEATNTQKTYEVKNRFRGRRPSEKPIEKTEVQTEAQSTTLRNVPLNRYSHRPRLSERYNRKPETEENEDQDTNYSINRPKYAEPDNEQWSPKFSAESFKPYNPNDIINDQKITTTEHHNNDETGDLDIITAKNEYDNILLSVTPPTNKANKKVPDISPTLEAIVEQSKITKSESPEQMSTFESMLEEVMKSLEEQDENEYTTNVMKHEGGEIGEIPPESVMLSEENQRDSTIMDKSVTTTEQSLAPASEEPASDLHTEEETNPKGRRRGFWKKVKKVRPVTTEAFETAESQFYYQTVNRLGDPVKQDIHDKVRTSGNTKLKVTTYKPNFTFKNDMFEDTDDEADGVADAFPHIDIPKINAAQKQRVANIEKEIKATTEVAHEEADATSSVNPGDLDLGTGSPDPTISDFFTTTEAISNEAGTTADDRSDVTEGFSLMEYLFGVNSKDEEAHENTAEEAETDIEKDITAKANNATTEQSKPVSTTENNFVPEEITAPVEQQTENVKDFEDIKKIDNSPQQVVESTDKSVVRVETSSVSSFMDPANVVSTSMSTEVSHETEICFRGKCIKTSKNINL